MSQLKEIAKDRGFNVFSYSNLRDGGGNSLQKSLSEGDFEFLATAVSSSEGEQVYMNFGRAVTSIGKAVAQYKRDNTPLLVLLDAIDSGASIDRQQELWTLMTAIERDVGVLGNASPQTEIYIVVAVNTYELAVAAPCIDVRDGKQYSFTSYGEYADFICRYFDRHPPDRVAHSRPSGVRTPKRRNSILPPCIHYLHPRYMENNRKRRISSWNTL